MEEDKKKSDESFISRWSKKKASEKNNIISSDKGVDDDKELSVQNESPKQELETTNDESKYDELNDDQLLEEFNLPNPDKIKKEKGLDLFFKDGVPDRLRQIALRRVWKLNPIIRFADAEINDYHEDFTDAATVVEGMQTAYKVGKGYLSDILEDKNEAEEEHTEKKGNDVNKEPKKESVKKENSGQKKNKKNKSISNKIKEEKQLPKENITVNKTTSGSDEIQFQAELEEKPKPKMMVFKPSAS